MTPATTDLLVNVGFVLVGALLRGHAPRLWNFVAPIFGATPTPIATQAASPTLPLIVQPAQVQGVFPRIYQPVETPTPAGPDTPKG